jgi:uncharacterized repeat protein (TIGR03803 family)
MRLATTFATLALLAGAGIATGGPASATGFQVVYSFRGGSDGNSPVAGLIDVGGTLFGTTFYGGGSGCDGLGCGTVFALNPTTGAEKVAYAFKGGSDAWGPFASLINVAGTLYGTTENGGATQCNGIGCGTVFGLNPKTGVERVVYAFKGGRDGASPGASLLNVGGLLFGTTIGGGNATRCGGGCGTVFAVNPATSAKTTVHIFKGGRDGVFPMAGLTEVGGLLYGTTDFGGASGSGTVFALNPTTGAETVVYSFKGGADAGDPVANLIDVDGTLYGTTIGGGGSTQCGGGCGTVFALNPVTGAETVVYAFQGGRDGADVVAGLIEVGGMLFGTTALGGAAGCGCGTVFAVDPATGKETVLYSFQGGDDGANPSANLIDLGGTLYGTAEAGGAAGAGTVFAITR